MSRVVTDVRLIFVWVFFAKGENKLAELGKIMSPLTGNNETKSGHCGQLSKNV